MSEQVDERVATAAGGTLGAPADLDTLAALEEQRAFLLRSLRDLERERAAGDIDEADYQLLRDDYTARAAEVLRAVKEHRALLAPPRRRHPWRAAAVVLAVLLLGAVAGDLLARFSGERLAGQQASGSVRGTADDTVSQAIGLFQQGKPVEALKLLDQVLKRDPRNPAALAYRGWLLRLAGRQAHNQRLVDEGFRWVDAAVAADPAYADAHFFKGLILLEDRRDPKAAIPELKAFLAANPPPDRAAAAQGMLQAAEAAASGTKPLAPMPPAAPSQQRGAPSLPSR